MGREKNKKKKAGRFVLSSILAFLLAVLLTAATWLLAVYIGFFNEGLILNSLNYKDYYGSIEKVFYEDAEAVSTPMGIPAKVLEGIVDAEKIHDDVVAYVKAGLSGNEYPIETVSIQDSLADNVRIYFAEEDMEMTEEQEATLPAYTEMIAKQYENDIKVPMIASFGRIKPVVEKVVLIGMPACVVLCIILIVILIRLYRWKHRALRFITYSTIASAIMVAIAPGAALISGFYKRINIGTEYLYYALVRYIENGFKVFLYFSVGLIVISIGLLISVKYMKKNS